MNGPETVFKRPYFFDTSALVKLVVPEPGAKYVRMLREQDGAILHTSTFAIAETMGVLKRLRFEEEKAGTMTAGMPPFTRYRWRLVSLFTIGPPQFEVHELGKPLLRFLGKLMDVSPDVDVVDIIHAAIFEGPPWATLDGPSRPIMVSADRALNDYCRTKSIEVRDPVEEERKMGTP